MPDKENKFDKNKYDQKFHRENYTRYVLSFRNNSDTELIQKLNSIPNKTDYIRQLVLADIKKSQQNWNLLV